MKSQTGDLLIKEIFKELEIKFHYTLTKNAVKFEVKIIYPNGDGDSFQTFFYYEFAIRGSVIRL
jgi:hypothetical protein